MQTYVAHKAHRLPPAQEQAVQQRDVTPSAAESAQLQLSEILNRSPRVQGQLQLQRMLNQSPAVVAQMKLAESLSRPSAVQREAVPDEEEVSQAKFDPAQRQGEVSRQAEEEELLQGKFEPVQRESALEDEQTLQGRFEPVQRLSEPGRGPAQAVEPNRTGLPDTLKSGVEALSGISLSDVRVHYNSPEPAQLSALAYAQGSDIHVAPGQEQHLPHEAWHVVQQKQGRVQPTMQAKGVAINDETALELEADWYGMRALRLDAEASTVAQRPAISQRFGPVVQRNGFSWNYTDDYTLWSINQAQNAIRAARQQVPYAGNITSDIDASYGESTARLSVMRDILTNTFGDWEQRPTGTPNAFNRAAAAVCTQGGACNEFSALTHSALTTQGPTTEPIIRVWDPHAHHSFTMIGDPRQTSSRHVVVADAWVPNAQAATLADTRWDREISPGHLDIHTQTPLLTQQWAQQNLADYWASINAAAPSGLPTYSVNRTAGRYDPRAGLGNESYNDYLARVRTRPGFAFGNQWSTIDENPYYYLRYPLPYYSFPNSYPYAQF